MNIKTLIGLPAESSAETLSGTVLPASIASCVADGTRRAAFTPFAISSSGLPCANREGTAATKDAANAILVTRDTTDDTFMTKAPNDGETDPADATNAVDFPDPLELSGIRDWHMMRRDQGRGKSRRIPVITFSTALVGGFAIATAAYAQASAPAGGGTKTAAPKTAPGAAVKRAAGPAARSGGPSTASMPSKPTATYW